MRDLALELANKLANRVIPSVFLTCSLAASVAQAAPQGGSVVAGQGHISNSANITTINQYTGSMVVDWSSFNVSASETVNFNQPSSSSSALNRINDQNPSQIFGAINANGRIFLSNPNGMIFGETASVNVGSLFATGLSISNENFMSGNYRFTSDGYTPGDIINHGTLLAATGGSISLVGGRAVNTGRIVADYGQVNLASGKTAVVSFDPAGMIGFEVSGDVEQNITGAESAVSNTGSLQSQGGRVVLEANVAADVFTYAVNNEGMIAANRINDVGGEVYLLGNDGTTVHSGHVDAYGDNGQGGSVFLLGDNVGVFEAGSIQASGDQGGGTVLIGGDWQGEGDTQTASRTYLSDESSVSADAVITGDGGKVVAWADESTLYLGHISARGGAGAGDGGQVEVSGKQALIFEGEVDLSSTNGDVGKLLLDPADIEISNAANSDITAVSPFSDLTDNGDTSVLNITTLQGALNTADVTVTTTTSAGNAPLNGTITVKEAVSWSTNKLNLVADNNIVIESGANMTASGTGAMDFSAADKIDVNATLTTASSGSISLTSGSNNGDDITFGDAGGSGAGSITTSGGTVTLKAYEVVIDNTAATVIDAGTTGDVIVSTSSASREINVGNDNNSVGMDLSNTTLNKISASTLQIGDATHTGDIEVLDSKPVSLSKVDTVALVNNGNVIINDDLSNTKAGGSILLNADAGNDGGTGAVTAGNGDLLTAASVDLKAASGIGTAANNIHTATSTITFENTASNGVYINNTGSLSVSGNNTASTTRITNNNDITLAAAGISSAGTARIDSTSGSINGTGTITATTADLRAANGIGNSGVLSLIVDNLIFDNSASNAVDVSNAKATGVTVQGDNLGTNTTITETTGNIILHSNDISTAGVALIDSTLGSINGSGSITADSVDLRAATGIGDSGDIATIADVVAFDNSGSNAVDIRNTMATGVSVSGSNNGTGATFTESTGDITLAAANITTSGTALIDSTLGSINGSGSVNAATADLRAATGIGNSGSVSTVTDVVMFDNSGSNAVDISNTMATGVTVSGSNSGTNTTILENTGNIILGASNISTGGTALIDSTLGSINGSGSVTAGTADLRAATGIGNSGAIATAVDTLAFDNSSSNAVNVANTRASGLTVSGSNTGANTTILENSGNITLGVTGISSAGSALIDSTSGSINGAGTITAATADLRAANGIGNSGVLSIIVNTLAFDNSSSNVVAISNTRASGLAVSGTNSGTTTSITETSGTMTVNSITSTGGDLTLTADEMVITGPVNATAQDVFLQASSGTGFDLGSAGDVAANTVELSDAELNAITANSLIIGDSSAGDVDISASVMSAPAFTTLVLRTAGAVDDGVSGALLNNRNLVVDGSTSITLDNAANNMGDIALTSSGDVTIVDASLLTIDSVNVDGTTYSGISGNNIDLTSASGGVSIARNIDALGTIDITARGFGQILSHTAGTITATSGAHSYTADEMNLAATIDASGQMVTLKNYTAGRTVDLGGSGATPLTSLELDNSELNTITADTVVIGSTANSAIELTANITPSSFSTLHLVSGGTISDLGAAGIDIANLALTAGGDIGIDNAASDIGTLAIDAAGASVFLYADTVGSVGDVDGVEGIQANDLALIVANGDIDISDGAAANDIDVSSQAAIAAQGGNITGAGTIVVPELILWAPNNDSIELTSINNDVDVLSAGTSATITELSSFIFEDIDDLTVGTVSYAAFGAPASGIRTAALELTANGLLTIDASSSITTTSTGTFDLFADDMAIAGQIDSSGGTVTLETATSGNAIDLGASPDTLANGILELSDAELDNIFAGVLTIGDETTTGGITISSDIQPANVNTIHLKAGGNITASAASLTGNKNLAITNTGNVTFDSGSTDVFSLAVDSDGDVVFHDADDLQISDIDGVAGVSGVNIDLRSLTSYVSNQSSISASGSGNIDITAAWYYYADTVGDLAGGSGDIAITAEEIYLFNGNVSGTGNLLIQQVNDSQTMGLGDAAAGWLNLDSSELALIQDGFNSVTFGNSSTGNVDVTSVTFTDRTSINGRNITYGTIDATGNALAMGATGVIRQNTAGSITAVSLDLTALNQAADPDAIGIMTEKLNIDIAGIVDASVPGGGNIWLTSPGDITVGAISTSDYVTIDAGTGGAGAIIDGNGVDRNITAQRTYLTAVDGIGADGNPLEIDSGSLYVNNTGIGDIYIAEANDLIIAEASNKDGDIDIVANNNITLADALKITTTDNGSVALFAGNAINAIGEFEVDAKNGFTYSQDINAAGPVTITTGDQLTLNRNITTTTGDITLASADIVFSGGLTLTAAGLINIPNGTVAGNGDQTLNANGIKLPNAFTVNNGNVVLNAGTKDLSVGGAVTVESGDLSIVAADLEIDPKATITGSDIVTISDSGNGIALGSGTGSNLNISINEYDLITAGSLVLETDNGLTLQDESFVSVDSTSPLTIDANEMTVVKGAVFGVNSDLDLADTALTANAGLTMNAGGAFAMNNSITTNGVFELNVGAGITMTEPTSITSNNNNITMTAAGGDILLGLVDAGNANVDVTAEAGSILNNNGVFTDVTLSKINLIGTNVKLTANQRIGASSTDAITINASPAGSITLDFNADKAFINNLQNTRIINNGSGQVAVGLIFSGQIIGIGHNVGVYSQETNEAPETMDNQRSFLSVLGSDYKVTELEEEEDDASTINTVVPVMIRTKDGWEFKAPSSRPGTGKDGERKVNWL